MGLFGKKDSGKVVHVTYDEVVEKMDAPWVRAGRAYDDTFLRLTAQSDNWRRFAFIMAMVTIAAVIGVVYIGAQAKFIPYLIEVDKLGRTLAVKAVSGDEAITDPKRLVYREMVELFENCRTVTTDISANNKNIHQCFVRLKGAARNYAQTELRKAPPNEVGATKTVQVEVKTALAVTDKTWQVEWIEHSYALTGVEMKIETWKALVKYDLKPSGEEKDIRENPIGFTVSELNWMKVI